MAKSSWDWNAFRLAVIEAGIRGELTADWRAANPDVEPAHVLLERIAEEKAELIRTKQIRKEKPLPPIAPEEVPFDIPSTWEWSRLIQVCVRTGSGATPRGGKSAYVSEGVPFLRSQNVLNGSLDISDAAHITEETHASMSHTEVRPDDVLLNITGGSIGRSCVVPKSFVRGNVNQHVSIIRACGNMSPDYLSGLFLSPFYQAFIETAQTGAGREGLPKGKMDLGLIPIPPPAEQKEVVRILSALDSGESDGPVHPVVARIQKLEQEFRALAGEYESQEKWLADLRSALLQEAISGQLTADWRSANPDAEPAHVLLERIAEEKAELIRTKQIRKEKPLPPISPDEVPFDIPSTWVLSHLGGLCRSISDGAHKTPKYTEDGVRFLSIKDVSGGKLDLSNTRRISVEEHIELIKRCKPERGDILFCRIGTLGRPVVVNIDEEFSIFVSLGLLKFFPQYIKPAFLCHVLDSPFLWSQYMKVKATGSHTNKLNLRDMPGLVIPLPPVMEQEAILVALSGQLKKMDALQQELERSKAAAQLLMKSKLAEVFEPAMAD